MSHRAGPVSNPGPEHLDKVTEMLTRAFDGDPLIEHLFPRRSTESRHAVMRFACLVRFELSWPLLGFLESGRIVGAAGLTVPEDKPWPADLRNHYETLKEQIGGGAIARLEHYSKLTDHRRPSDPHYHLGVIGVDPDKQGRGVGRALIEAVQVISQEHPTSTGVWLDTENPQKVDFYTYMGYRVTDKIKIGLVHVWCFFRPDEA